jgi:hypothetical protein
MAYRRLCIDEEGGVGVSMLWEYVGDAWDAWGAWGAWEYVGGIPCTIFLLQKMPCFPL